MKQKAKRKFQNIREIGEGAAHGRPPPAAGFSAIRAKNQSEAQAKLGSRWRGRTTERASFRHQPEARLIAVREDEGDAIVEATILFPIMILVFAALVMLAIYLPTHAALQRATQTAATAIAIEESDTWLFFEDGDLSFRWETDKSSLQNVYAALFSDIEDAASRTENIVTSTEAGGISSKAGELTVDCQIVNKIVYKEIIVTATRDYTIPGNFSIIGFPKTITITASSTAVVQNGDEFIRNMDLAVGFIEYIGEKFGITNISETISTGWEKVSSLLGW